MTATESILIDARADADVESAAAESVPYDVTALTHGCSEPAIRWPYAASLTYALDQGLSQAFDGLVHELRATPSERLFDIATPTLYGGLLVLGSAFLTSVCAARKGIVFRTRRTNTLLSDLQSGDYRRTGGFFDLMRGRIQSEIRGAPLMALRRAAHAVQKSGLSARRADILCFNPNPLVKAEAAAARGVGFRFAWPDSLFPTPPDFGEHAKAENRDLAEHAVAQLQPALTATGVDAEVPPKLKASFAKAAAQWLADLSTLHNVAQLPSRAPEIWTGTGFNTLTRIARVRAQAESRQVLGFDHAGGGNQAYEDLIFFRLGELGLCDAFVCETDARAQVLHRRLQTEASAAPGAAVEIRGRKAQCGSFVWRDTAADPQRAPKRVLYVPTAFVGERQHPNVPLLPDPVYAAWQERLLEAVAAVGYDALIKSHPEGDLRGRPLLLGESGRFVTGSFEEALEQADVLLFDYPATTTLWQSMCTRLPIVFIDLQQVRFHPAFDTPFRQRVAVVSADYDARNIPEVSMDALAEALERPAGGDWYAADFLIGTER